MICLPKFYKKCNKSDKNDNQDVGTVAIYLLTGEGSIPPESMFAFLSNQYNVSYA